MADDSQGLEHTIVLDLYYPSAYALDCNRLPAMPVLTCHSCLLALPQTSDLLYTVAKLVISRRRLLTVPLIDYSIG